MPIKDKPEHIKLNLGCGSHAPADWINIDYAIGARVMKLPLFRVLNRKMRFFSFDWDEHIYIHNLTKPLPWKDNTVQVIYSSHTLEHLSRKDGRKLLTECYRVLQKGGIIRIVVPDLAHFVKKYQEAKFRADEFVEELGVLYENNKNPLKNWLAPFLQFPHKCMYDTPTLLTILQETGFYADSRKPFDSSIPGIEHIEMEDRARTAAIVEGTKR